MAPETIARLDADFALAPGVLRGTPATDRAVAEAASTLKCRFDPDYAEFLKRYGCGMVGSLPVFGVGPVPDAMGIDDGVVAQTARFRGEGWPGADAWYVISNDGRGNPIGVDAEGRVWVSDHDVGDLLLIAPNFEQFLLNQLP